MTHEPDTEPDRAQPRGRHRRLAPLGVLPERLGATMPDPADVVEAGSAMADAVALALVTAGREDPADVERLVRLADEVGLEELDGVWRAAEPGSLAAGLRVLYLLRTWARSRPADLARLLAAGRVHAEVSATVAGVPAHPDPADVLRLADDVLRGALGRDLATALHRAAALCRVIAAGRGAEDPVDPDNPWADSTLGARLLSTAEELETVAASTLPNL